ncbi:hypothetical protein COX84_00330 [Candidatus Micrarchaeota archaeon CG_4_10_14_0_2_um_filter_49_7]|nr:MAG: hypothetical protein AUJ13_05660 [Candidatus Micrarchaeota archaeon CG1_02_49_24]PIZ99986.1 MAG: hypothetical protein COX84_00330 [Candidatus Micrarchaeota archaeon CG_4_10_14_0_2_um_filter_49_7]HII53867.1 hypothetical protein [Candidatus Micrarchaeota archaeon]
MLKSLISEPTGRKGLARKAQVSVEVIAYFAFFVAFMAVIAYFIISQQQVYQNRIASNAMLALAEKLSDYMTSLVQSDYAQINLRAPAMLGGYPYNITFSNKGLAAINLGTEDRQSYMFSIPTKNITDSSGAPGSTITVFPSAGILRMTYNSTNSTLRFG